MAKISSDIIKQRIRLWTSDWLDWEYIKYLLKNIVYNVYENSSEQKCNNNNNKSHIKKKKLGIIIVVTNIKWNINLK